MTYRKSVTRGYILLVKLTIAIQSYSTNLKTEESKSGPQHLKIVFNLR